MILTTLAIKVSRRSPRVEWHHWSAHSSFYVKRSYAIKIQCISFHTFLYNGGVSVCIIKCIPLSSNDRNRQECIPVGCIPFTSVAILRGCLSRGFLARECLPRGCLPWGCLCPAECLPGGAWLGHVCLGVLPPTSFVIGKLSPSCQLNKTRINLDVSHLFNWGLYKVLCI